MKPFSKFEAGNLLMSLAEIGKRLDLSPWAKIERTKGILFSPTFEVWESKLPYSFIFVQRLRNCHFFLFCWPYKYGAILKSRRMGSSKVSKILFNGEKLTAKFTKTFMEYEIKINKSDLILTYIMVCF